MRIVLNYIKVSRVTEELDLSVCVLRLTEWEPKGGNYREEISTQFQNKFQLINHELYPLSEEKSKPIPAGAQRKQPDTKEQILCDSPYTKYIEQANSWRPEAD